MKTIKGYIRRPRRIIGWLAELSGGGGGGGSRTVEGVPPLGFSATAAGSFSGYRIYGNGDGSETQTVNLIPQDYTLVNGACVPSTGENVDSDTRVRTDVMTMPLMEDTNWYVCVSWKSKVNIDTDVRVFQYNTDGSFYFMHDWEHHRVDSNTPQREYAYFNTYRQFKSKIVFRRTDDGVISPGDIYDVQVEYNKNYPSAYQPPVNAINGVGNVVVDSDDPHFCEYKIPVTVGGSTTNIYLDTPLITSNDVSDYIDYETQKRYNADGTQEDVTLPELGFAAGSNTLSVGTVVQPTKVSVTGAVREEES